MQFLSYSAQYYGLAFSDNVFYDHGRLHFEKDEVIFKDFGRKGLITLNRPKQLNSLDYGLALKIYPKLKQWNSCKELIVIKGNKQAFCAGGDLHVLTSDKTGKRARMELRTHYAYLAFTASLKAPYLAIIHGLVMGGGVGLSIHAKYRVATEASVFAEPETQIGWFTDASVAHFLARMSKQLGVFLGLTGHRLKGFDLWHSGIATHYCHSSLLADFEKQVLLPNIDVDTVLRDFHAASVDRLPLKNDTPFSLAAHLNCIEDCFSAPTVEGIFERLENVNSEFSWSLLKILRRCCPASLKISFEHIKRAASMNVDEVANEDYRLCYRVLGQNDFYEGVRSMLVDKNTCSKWSHKCIEDVSDEEVNAYFQNLDEADELGLPQSYALPSKL